MRNNFTNEYNNIYCLYENVVSRPVITEEITPDTPEGVNVINVYSVNSYGSPEKSYNGNVVNRLDRDDSYTIIAKDNSGKVIEVTKMYDDETYSVKVISTSNNIEDSFVGKELGTFDDDTGELDIINTDVMGV